MAEPRQDSWLWLHFAALRWLMDSGAAARAGTAATAVYVKLLRHARAPEWRAYPSVATIADALGRKPRAVAEAITKLIEADLIERDGRSPDGATTCYRLIFPAGALCGKPQSPDLTDSAENRAPTMRKTAEVSAENRRVPMRKTADKAQQERSSSAAASKQAGKQAAAAAESPSGVGDLRSYLRRLGITSNAAVDAARPGITPAVAEAVWQALDKRTWTPEAKRRALLDWLGRGSIVTTTGPDGERVQALEVWPANPHPKARRQRIALVRLPGADA